MGKEGQKQSETCHTAKSLDNEENYVNCIWYQIREEVVSPYILQVPC